MTADLFDNGAERAVIASALTGRYAVTAAQVRPDDFHSPMLAAVWGVMLALEASGKPTDAVSVNAAMLADPDLARWVKQAPGLIPDLYGDPSAGPSAGHHALIVAELATLRRVDRAGQRLSQRAHERVDSLELLSWAREQVDEAGGLRAGSEHLSQPIWEMMHAAEEEYDWKIPGLLETGDRVVLTGLGGTGKSTLFRQICVMAAAGIHPFELDFMDAPLRVTVIDCENTDSKNRRQYRPLLAQAELQTKHDGGRGEGVGDRLKIGGGGNPIDLLDPARALAVLRTVERDKAELCYIGPFYKLHNEDPDKESTVKRVTAVLDGIREMGCCVLLEAHPNKDAMKGGSMAPSGSGTWGWWAEFGLGLRLDPANVSDQRKAFLERWRLDRDENSWPRELEQGSLWPWFG